MDQIKQKVGHFEEGSKTEENTITVRTNYLGKTTYFSMIQMILYQTKSDWLLLYII
jgi:hypothetical protein